MACCLWNLCNVLGPAAGGPDADTEDNDDDANDNDDVGDDDDVDDNDDEAASRSSLSIGSTVYGAFFVCV
jgi:hypothetical protein